MRLVFLDSGPLGLLANPHGKPHSDQCRRWAQGLLSVGIRVFIPEIADFEVRRKLLHIGSTSAIRRLDQLKAGFEYSAITTDAMLHAAELWAHLRRTGQPTAGPGSLDGDCILAAQALQAARPGDMLTVATDNVGHLERMVDARLWETIKVHDLRLE